MNAKSIALATRSCMDNAFNFKDIGEYSSFALAMSIYKFDWEAVKLETEDGFTISLFHVTGQYEIDEND